MTVRFPLIRRLLVGLVAALAGATAVGCADDSSKTDLIHEPRILQVMVFTDPSLAPSYLTDPMSGYAITYATQIPLGGNNTATSDYAVCYLFDPASGGQPSTLCQRPDQVADCTCPSDPIGPLKCEQSGDLIGRCVDPATDAIPIVTRAVPFGTSIHVVVGDLLDGASLEHFACACQGTDVTMLDPTNCPTGAEWSDSPTNCSICGGEDETVKGRCVDTDANGLPDITSLKPGAATITCTATAGPTGFTACPTDLGWTGTPASCVYITKEGDGFFYPSGSQFQSSVTGLGGVGPAININPASPLPTDTSCSIAMGDAIRFDSGASLQPPVSTPTWHTETLDVALAAPVAKGTLTITADQADLTIDVSVNVPTTGSEFTIDVTDLNSTDTFHAVNSSAVITDGTTLEAELPGIAPLVDGHIYLITVSGSVVDNFGTNSTLSEITVNSTAALSDTSAKK